VHPHILCKQTFILDAINRLDSPVIYILKILIFHYMNNLYFKIEKLFLIVITFHNITVVTVFAIK